MNVSILQCVFPDTSFLFALYTSRPQSGIARRYMGELSHALPVTPLLQFEWENAVRRLIYRNLSNRLEGLREGAGIQLLLDFDNDLRAGLWTPRALDITAVCAIASELSAKHTTAFGPRSFDILHVASALALGASVFLTFDSNQRRLAEAEGLTVPL